MTDTGQGLTVFSFIIGFYNTAEVMTDKGKHSSRGLCYYELLTGVRICYGLFFIILF